MGSRRPGLQAPSHLRASPLFHFADAYRHLLEVFGRNRMYREVWPATVWLSPAGHPGRGCAEWRRRRCV